MTREKEQRTVPEIRSNWKHVPTLVFGDAFLTAARTAWYTWTQLS
jgi:hypothetical protein